MLVGIYTYNILGHEIDVKVLGMGKIFQLILMNELGTIKQQLKLILEFINIKERQLNRLVRKHGPKFVQEIVDAIIKSNLKIENNKKTSSDTDTDIYTNVVETYEKIAIEIIAKLSMNTGWSIEYIMENISYIDAIKIIELQNKIEINMYLYEALAMHSPKDLQKTIDKMNNIKRASAEELMQELLNEKKKEGDF